MEDARRRSTRFGPDAGRLADPLRPVRGGLSGPALRLHVFGVLASIEAGRAGVITDDYLGAVRGETTLSVLELCAGGLWERGESGYRVEEHETLRLAAEVHRQLETLTQTCRVGGGHRADPDHPDECGGCGVRLG